ncbi:hypothetical protein HJG60_012158 [Phyllostomus discolor]|uniref:SAM domain-containing protein n=1 Tax=Phyllostomus discolor TaxID=89673 RepID=A0A833ZE08_9CHIR|nr:hypothetical protein HJG60_012158 [Phyllostomus discolor]
MNSKTSHNMTRQPTVTSSPTEIRLWIEELDYSFLVYGENFERAGINGEKLFNITRQNLTELGIIRTDHQNIILKAVSNINKKTKMEEQIMQPECQPDLNSEMESDMLDVCKGVTKMCNYVMDLPREVTGPEEISPRMQVPIATDPELMSLSVEHGPGFVPPTGNSSVPIAIRSSSSEHAFLLQDMSLQNEMVSYRSECFSPEILNSPSEGAVMMPSDKGKKSKTEFSDTKDFQTLADFWDYESLQEIPIIKRGFFLPDSESEKGMIGSDSDRGIDFDDDSEDQSKRSYSPKWDIDSDSETCPIDSDSVKQLLKGEYQIASGSVKDMIESEQHLGGVEQFQVDYDILKYWMESDSEIYLSDSDNERPDMDSDSEKCPTASASAKPVKADKGQMASDSIKRLIQSQRFIESMMVSASGKYVMGSGVEGDKMDSASPSGVQLIGKGKHQAKTRLKSSIMDSDSEPCGKDSNSERHALATVAAECLLGTKTCQLSTDTERCWIDSASERHTVDLDSESLGMVSDSVKHMKKAKSCQSEFAFEAFQVDLRPKSEKSSTDSARQQFDLDYDAYWDGSTSYEYMSARFQSSSERCQVDLQTHQDNFESHQLDSDSKKRGANSKNEKHQNEFESERHMMKMERGQCLIQLENERLQMDKEQEKYDLHPDSGKEPWIASGSERHDPEAEYEAQWLGARKKGNRPPGFWRPLFLLPSSGQAKKTEEKYSVQQTGNKGVSGIQHGGHLSDEKIVRCKEISPTVSDKQASQQKLKEKHSHNVSPDPNTLVGNKGQINASHKISSCKSHSKEYRQLQSFQSSASQINLLNAEDNKSEVSATDCHLTSMSPKSHSDTMDTRATICSKCFMEINNSSFHKCLGDSNNDSDSDCSLHLQSSFCSKYCLSPRPVRQSKTSQKSLLSQALDLEHMVGIRCPKHQRDSKYSAGCENCLGLQNLIHSTVTDTFPMNPENTTSHHSTSEPDNIINVSNVIGLESEVQFNLTTQRENEANSDNETELVSGDNLKIVAIVKDKPLLKEERDHEDKSDSEDETESEDEEDAENEDNTKDKKDPKDKSDRDDNDPKGSNSEKDADTNNGSDSSGNADRTSGADSNGDGNSNNGTDHSGRPDSNVDKGTNNDANSKHSTGSEEGKYTNDLENASGLNNDQHRTAGFNNGTNPNHTCKVQNGTGMDCTSNSNDDAGLSTATRSGNGIYLYNGTGATKEAGPNNNRSGPNFNESVLQNNGPGLQNNRQHPSLPGFNNNGSGLNTNPILNSNRPGPNDDISVLENDPDFNNNNTRPYHASHNTPFSSNKDVDSNCDTKSTNDFDHNYSAVPNYYSDPDYVSRFIEIVGSSFVVNPNNITKSRYAVRPSSTNDNGNGNVSDGGNSASCGGAINPSYIAFTSYASDTIHETRFIHVTGSIFVTTPNCDAINTINVHNSTSTTNITFSEPKLEIGSSFSIPNIVYDRTPPFGAGTNYTFTPENLTTFTSFAVYKFGGNYTSTDYHKLGVYTKANDGSMDSIFMHATESKYVLDAKESGLSKYFSSVQNPLGIKDHSSLNFCCDTNILLLSFDIIIEAEQPDVVKFAISSGAVNLFVKCKMFSVDFQSKMQQNHLLCKNTGYLLKLNLQTGSRQNLGH